MTREIKFRGICSNSKNIVHGDLIRGVGQKSGLLFILPFQVNLRHIPYCDPLDGVQVIPETLGQFTGFKDSNGIEIYEGDILSCKVFIDGKWEDSVEPVIFKDGCFGLDWSFSKDGSYWEILTKEIEGKKILGNIYENPELLERSVKADA